MRFPSCRLWSFLGFAALSQHAYAVPESIFAFRSPGRSAFPADVEATFHIRDLNRPLFEQKALGATWLMPDDAARLVAPLLKYAVRR